MHSRQTFMVAFIEVSPPVETSYASEVELHHPFNAGVCLQHVDHIISVHVQHQPAHTSAIFPERQQNFQHVLHICPRPDTLKDRHQANSLRVNKSFEPQCRINPRHVGLEFNERAQ